MQRLFCALDLPREIREGIDAWGNRELSDPALRRIRPGDLHMTVRFIGWTPAERVDEAVRAVGGIESRLVRVRFRLKPVAKPAGRPALYAIEADAPEAQRLAEEVSGAVVGRGLAEADPRPFWPHVTVARVRSEEESGGSGRRRPQRVEHPPGPLPDALGGEFSAVRLSLYRSMMRRDGSNYVPLSNVDLR